MTNFLYCSSSDLGGVAWMVDEEEEESPLRLMRDGPAPEDSEESGGALPSGRRR
jgi:hypothetical protein